MSTLVAQTISNGTVSTSSANVIQGSAKAWVNFNGTGTVAINGSYNVSSITDNGTGDYTINFTNALPNANYSVIGNASNNNTFGSILVNINSTSSGGNLTSTPTTTATRLTVAQPNIGYIDTPFICVSVFD
jgi:hypothetical protein